MNRLAIKYWQKYVPQGWADRQTNHTVNQASERERR